jgi:N-acyl homoserine lactone hydrolase
MDASGGPRRLYLFRAIDTTTPERDFVAGSYLVQMADGRNVLVDTGPPADMGGPDANVTTALDRLQALGLGPDDIDTVVVTHLDVDHAGVDDAFTKAEHVIQRDHLERARGGHQRFARNRAVWDKDGLRYRTVDGDTDLLPGVRLLATPGHTVGHQSVLLRLPNTGSVLLAIDAVPNQQLFAPDRPQSHFDEDLEQVRASTRKLLQVVEDEDVKLTVHHHDAPQWRTLKLAPDYYD